MCARKPIVIAVVVALLVALASMFTVSVFLPWSHAVNVPNMTLEQWQALSEIQRNEFLQSHTLPLKGISGFEKFFYFLKANPMGYLHDFLYFAVPSVIAAVLAVSFPRGDRAA